MSGTARVWGDTAKVADHTQSSAALLRLAAHRPSRQTIATVSSTVRSACTTPFVSACRTITKPSPS